MKVWNGSTKYENAHVKYDGHMLIIKVTAENIIFLSRDYEPLSLHWHPVMLQLMQRVPPNTELHCELWKPNEPASYVKSGIKNRDKGMRVTVFAIPSMRYRASLQELYLRCAQWGLEFAPWYGPGIGALGPFDGDPTRLEEFEHSEGWVLKDGNMTEHFKFKPFLDADLIVKGFTYGSNSNACRISSIDCGLYGNDDVIASVSGFTIAEMEEMTENQHDLIGRVCEVKYQYVGSQGRLRHPNFVRWRDDKPSTECDSL